MNYADELNVDMKEHKKHEKEFIEKSIKDIDGKVKHVKNTYIGFGIMVILHIERVSKIR